jgi:hypothetical protein
MLKNAPDDRVIRIADKLMEHAAELESYQPRPFGYNERMAIERQLFLIIAYSGPFWPLIPIHSGHPFQAIPAGHSD